jgi:hypothetical protein
VHRCVHTVLSACEIKYLTHLLSARVFDGLKAFAIAVAIGILNTSLVWRRETGDWVAANVIALTLLVVLWILQALLVGLFGFHSWLGKLN